MSTFDEELDYIIAQGCWDFVNHVTGKDSREKVVNDMAKDIKALIKKHQPERIPERKKRDEIRRLLPADAYNYCIDESDKAYGLEA